MTNASKGKYRFFFHYNKPVSKQKGEPYLSVHWKNQCIIVKGDRLKVTTPIESKVNKRQPHVVMQGFAKNIYHTEEKTIIT